MGRKSTAQPRPVLNIPPRGIGPIADPNENDVLSGRGGRINSHPGNVQFRDVIAAKKKEYLAPTTKKLEKAHIAAAIVNDIRHMTPPGRFLKEDADTGLWWDIGDAKAIKKTGQALREDAPDIRPEIDGDSDGDHGEDGKKSPKADKPKVAAKKSPPKVKKEPVSPKSNTPMPQQQNQQGQRQTSMGQTIATAQIPIAQPQFQQNMMAGPQHVPGPGGWQQQNRMMSQMDYQAQQMAMPPPYVQQPNMMNNFQQQQVPMQNAFQQQNMPMQQAPTNQGFVQGMANFPNNLYSGARSVGGRVAAASKQAMNVLGQSSQVPDTRTQAQRMQDEMAFGRTFHPPAAVMNSDNTMSEISGLSDPLSGLSLESGAKGSALSNFSGLTRASAMSGQQKGSVMSLGGGTRRSRSPKNRQRDSLRLSQVGRSGVMSALGQMGSSRMSELTLSNRSLGGMSRSHSFPDMGSVMDGEAWNAIVEGDELMEGSVTSGRASMTSGRMSIMSLGSENSSSRWLANLREMDDGKSYLSEMSSDLNALDLARDQK